MKNLLNHKLIEDIISKASEILPRGSEMSIFGSRARNEAREDSDWDLHILIPGEEQLSLEDIGRYSLPFENIGLKFMEIVSPNVYTYKGWLKRKFLPFYKNVENDKIIIFKN